MLARPKAAFHNDHACYNGGVESIERKDAGAVGALEDDLRRAMFEFIRARREPVSRDEVATELGISRTLAAFHLDKLAERGLLGFEFARSPDQASRGVGRPAKRYRPTDAEIEVSIPARRYQLAADILARAMKAESPKRSARRVAVGLARERGREMGDVVRRELGLRPPGPERSLSVTGEVLRRNGYEPYSPDRGRLELSNCPFDGIVGESPDLMCGLNEALVEGVVEGIGGRGVRAVLDPAPGRCCVRLELERSAASPA